MHPLRGCFEAIHVRLNHESASLKHPAECTSTVCEFWFYLVYPRVDTHCFTFVSFVRPRAYEQNGTSCRTDRGRSTKPKHLLCKRGTLRSTDCDYQKASLTAPSHLCCPLCCSCAAWQTTTRSSSTCDHCARRGTCTRLPYRIERQLSLLIISERAAVRFKRI